MAMAMAKGRQPGKKNNKNGYQRTEVSNSFRCTLGYITVVDRLVASGLYRSKADVYHMALSVLALRHRLDDDEYNYFVDKIL